MNGHWPSYTGAEICSRDTAERSPCVPRENIRHQPSSTQETTHLARAEYPRQQPTATPPSLVGAFTLGAATLRSPVWGSSALPVIVHYSGEM